MFVPRTGAPPTHGREERVSIWLVILIVVLIVLLLGGFGYSRR
jgi:hypothetical protein